LINTDLTSDGLVEEIQQNVKLFNRIALTIQFGLKTVLLRLELTYFTLLNQVL